MPIDFKYVPVSGPLAGRSFEEQTERAFNELGNNISGAYDIAQEALGYAENAQVTSNEALDTANTAIVAAQHAETSAVAAEDSANQALIIAQEAESAVAGAVEAATLAQDMAESAHETADHAQEMADTALANSDYATSIAISAEIQANAANSRQSGGFVVVNEPVNTTSTIDAQRVYASVEITDTPVTAPAYFISSPTSDQAAVTQEVWAEASPTPFIRTGNISWNAPPGVDTHALTAVPLEGADINGELSVTHTGAILSANFTPGGFSGAQSSLFVLGGELTFVVGENFNGSVKLTNSGVELLQVDGGNVVLMTNESISASSNIFLVSAVYTGDVLVLTVQITWTAKTYDVDWGSWYSGGGGGATIPRGLICMWSGAVNNVPDTWALCDGTNGTPNLSNKFIRGAGDNAPGFEGGALTHNHTATVASTTVAITVADESTPITVSSTTAATTISSTTAATTIGATTLTTTQMPKHSHPQLAGVKAGASGTYGGGQLGSYGTMDSGLDTSDTGGGGSHTHTATGTAHAHTATGTAHTHTATTPAHDHTATSTAHTHTASTDSVEVLPPYYTLAYIMKL